MSTWVFFFFNSCFTFLFVALQVRTDCNKGLDEVRDCVDALAATASDVDDGLEDVQSHIKNLDMHKNNMLGTANQGEPPYLVHLPPLSPVWLCTTGDPPNAYGFTTEEGFTRGQRTTNWAWLQYACCILVHTDAISVSCYVSHVKPIH